MNKRILLFMYFATMACTSWPTITASATPVVGTVQPQQQSQSQETKPECTSLKERIKEKIKACKQYCLQHKRRVLAIALVTGALVVSALHNHHYNNGRNNHTQSAPDNNDPAMHCTCGDRLTEDNGFQRFTCNHGQCLSRDCWPSNDAGTCPRCHATPAGILLAHCMNAHSCVICHDEAYPLTAANVQLFRGCKHGLHQQCWQNWTNTRPHSLCVVCQTGIPLQAHNADQGIFGNFLTHCRNIDPRAVIFVLDTVRVIAIILQ